MFFMTDCQVKEEMNRTLLVSLAIMKNITQSKKSRRVADRMKSDFQLIFHILGKTFNSCSGVILKVYFIYIYRKCLVISILAVSKRQDFRDYPRLVSIIYKIYQEWRVLYVKRLGNQARGLGSLLLSNKGLDRGSRAPRRPEEHVISEVVIKAQHKLGLQESSGMRLASEAER